MRVDINLIRSEDRIRSVDAARVEALSDSIAEVGLLNPITVYERDVIRSGNSVPGYGLIAGAHRLEACRALGLAEIDVAVVVLEGPRRVIAECDENLCVVGLSEVDRALFTAKRKAAYEALHPETAHGAIGNGREKSRQVGDSSPPSRFTTDTAAKTGASERSVQRAAERGEKVCEEALRLIRGTALDKGAYLDKLKALDSTKQIAKAERDLRERDKPKTPRQKAPPPDDDEQAVERQVKALVSAWNKAGPEARADFLDRIGGEIVARGRAA